METRVNALIAKARQPGPQHQHRTVPFLEDPPDDAVGESDMHRLLPISFDELEELLLLSIRRWPAYDDTEVSYVEA